MSQNTFSPRDFVQDLLTISTPRGAEAREIWKGVKGHYTSRLETLLDDTSRLPRDKKRASLFWEAMEGIALLVSVPTTDLERIEAKFIALDLTATAVEACLQEFEELTETGDISVDVPIYAENQGKPQIWIVPKPPPTMRSRTCEHPGHPRGVYIYVR